MASKKQFMKMNRNNRTRPHTLPIGTMREKLQQPFYDNFNI